MIHKFSILAKSTMATKFCNLRSLLPRWFE